MANLSVLPEGVSKETFLKAVGEYSALLGADNVIVDPDRLVPYTKLMIPVDENRYEPAGALLVSSVEQVQQVVGICNRYKIPVWPISTGGNFGYGTTMPAVPGQMILDLGRMNRIIEIDTTLCTALVEPGVTYHQLYEYINANEIPLWLAVPGPGPLVGPVGQALERGQGYTAIAEQYESICGMEVVLGTGEIVRTGFGGVAGSTAWQANKYGYGPHLDGIFTQSNFGIVTKLGMWLTPRPEKYKLFAAAFPHIDDIAKSVDVARDLKLRHVVEGPILTGVPISGMQMISGSKRSDIVKTDAPISRKWLEDYTAAQGLSQVGAFGAVTGSPEEVAVKYAEVKKAFNAAGAMVVDELLLQLAPMFHHMVHSLTGVPDLQEMNMLNWVGGGGCVWFAPICPARGDEALAQINLAWPIIEKHGFDFNGGFFHNGRSMINAMSLLFDKSDSDAQARAYACFDELHKTFAAKGYAAYRTNIAFMDQTAEVFGPAQREINRKLKRALDPNGIIGIGKSGIHLA